MQPYYFTRFLTTEEQLNAIAGICSFMMEKKKGNELQLVVTNNDFKLLMTNGLAIKLVEHYPVVMYHPSMHEPSGKKQEEMRHSLIFAI